MSDKAFKTASHRQERVALRACLAHETDPPHRHAFGDQWDGPKDGKVWWGRKAVRLLRK